MVEFTVLADHRIDLKETEEINKNLDLATELKNLQNMNVTVVIGMLGTVQKSLGKILEEMKIRGRVGTKVQE